jgi:cyclopropane fatty-acyl-phospholipid synthase-like methyltransferase
VSADADLPQLFQRSGLSVELYDLTAESSLIASSLVGDVAFYTELALESGGPVLEVASGTGRVAWELARAGVDVVGFDLSRAMIACAEAKRAAMPEDAARRVTFFHGNMLSFDAGLRFPLIIVPFRAFQVLLTPENQRRSLECMHEHLTDDGRLVIDNFDPRLEYLTRQEEPWTGRLISDQERGTTVEITIEDRNCDVVNQVLHEVWHAVERDVAGTVLREQRDALDLRWSYRYEMRHLFELCGLEVEAEYSDFQRSAPDYAKEQVWIVRRASQAKR